MTGKAISRWRLSPRVRQLLQRAGILFGAGLLAYQMVVATTRIDWRAATLPGFGQALAAIALLCAALFIQMVAWRWIVVDLGSPLSLGMVVRGYFLSFLPRYIPGTAWGYLSRGAWFEKNAGVRLGLTSASSLLETATFLLSGLGYLLWSGLGNGAGAVAGVAVTATGYITLRLLLSRIPRFGLPQPSSRLAGLSACLAICAVWPFYGTALGVLMHTPQIGPQTVIQFGSDFYVAWAGGMLAPFVPAGLGVREIIMSRSLALNPTSAGQAAVLPLLLRVCTLLAELAWVGVGMALNLQKSAGNDRTTQAGDSPEPHF